MDSLVNKEERLLKVGGRSNLFIENLLTVLVEELHSVEVLLGEFLFLNPFLKKPFFFIAFPFFLISSLYFLYSFY